MQESVVLSGQIAVRVRARLVNLVKFVGTSPQWLADKQTMRDLQQGCIVSWNLYVQQGCKSGVELRSRWKCGRLTELSRTLRHTFCMANGLILWAIF